MKQWLARISSNAAGTVIEAWQELRIHRLRVILSLVGVGVAVCALTTVVALGAIAEQTSREVSERYSGRPATLTASIFGAEGPVDSAVTDEAWIAAMDRYEIDYWSRNGYGSLTAQFVDGAVPLATQVVDVDFAEIHRLRVVTGSWFTERDVTRLAPPIVINEKVWDRLGRPPIESHPTLQLLGEQKTTAVVVGVTPAGEWDGESTFMLADAYLELSLAPPGTEQMGYEAWVPEGIADQLVPIIDREIEAAIGAGAQVDVYRTDSGAWGEDPFLATKLMVGGVAMLVLLLGALGLVNISLVTVKHRIREIGIRRSFGATSGRVFFGVMMESVVGTFVAGVVGVMAAILIVKSPWVEQTIGQGLIEDFPPFPTEAALLGIVAATVVGAIAGLLPAIAAVRVKVIDAIRF